MSSSKSMMHAIAEQQRRRRIIIKMNWEDNSYAWHVWEWWLNSFDLIDAQRVAK